MEGGRPFFEISKKSRHSFGKVAAKIRPDPATKKTKTNKINATIAIKA
jgi:hypothetical protein